MKVLPNGYFSVEYSAEELKHGLRKSKHAPRNSKNLTLCNGLLGKDGVLRSLDDLDIHSLIAASGDVVLGDFPFPQVFVLDLHLLVCNRTSILELKDGALVPMITGLTAGGKWNIASAFDFIYLTNGKQTVLRSPESNTYSLSTSSPVGRAACNYNGQFIVGYI